MATRQETQRRREALRDFYMSLPNTHAAGEMVPPVRELAVQFKVSVPVALEVVKSLVDEGVLTTVSSVGTFIGRPAVSQPDLYLQVYEDQGGIDAMRAGFEDRISQLGGTSLVLGVQAAQAYFQEGIHPNIAGVFRGRSTRSKSPGEVPNVWQVEFGHITPEKPHTDMVYFDNTGGAVQATRHLLQLGHTRIAFLGLHGQTGSPETFVWSQERENGWKNTLQDSGHPVEGLVFQPLKTSKIDRDSQIEAARQTARALLERSDITGIVATNSFAARGLFETLQEARIAEENWPAVVTFDDYQVLDGLPVTSLRLPWEEIGRTGADLLWQRRQRQLTGPPEQRLVSMRLISRLSCRPDWAQSLGLVSDRGVLRLNSSQRHGELELAHF